MNLDNLNKTDQHQQILLLLPWYLNQTLELAEQQRVERHIRSCMLCRRELVYLGKLATALKQESDLDVADEASFHELKAKLPTTRQQPEISIVPPPVSRLEIRSDVASTLSPSRSISRRQLFRPYFGAREALLAIATSLLLAIIPQARQDVQTPPIADYYTLSASKPESSAGKRLRVVFKNTMSEADIKALLAQIQGQPIEGPNNVGAYTVQLDAGKNSPNLPAAIAFLRKQQAVMLAEPIFQP